MLANTTVLGKAYEIEPVEGRSLRECLARGERPDRAKLVDWGIQLLEILADAHSEGFPHGRLTEDEVIVRPEGDLAVRFAPLLAFPSGELLEELSTVEEDLLTVGCLLRRLAFSASLRGGRALGERDPLVKVLARATCAHSAARYQSAAEMAEALRDAGQVQVGPRRLEARGVLSKVAEFPGSSRPTPSAQPRQKRRTEEGDLWCAMVLLVTSLLLMSFALGTGWFILARDHASWSSPAPSMLRPPHPGPQDVSAH